jgi:ABC-2 type transport system ATP-binding protein
MENPKLLVLDEPTNSLDSEGVTIFRNLIMDFREEGKTILLTSHNMQEIEALCDAIFHIDNGSIISSVFH